MMQKSLSMALLKQILGLVLLIGLCCGSAEREAPVRLNCAQSGTLGKQLLWQGVVPEKFRIEFAFRGIHAREKGDRHFGLILKGEAGKRLMLLTRGTSLTRVKPKGGEALIGKFGKPLAFGEDATLSVLSLSFDSGLVEANLDKRRIGCFEADLSFIREIEAYSYHVDLEIENFHLDPLVPPPPKIASVKTLEFSFDGNADALRDGITTIAPTKATNLEFVDGLCGQALHVSKRNQELRIDISALMGDNGGTLAFWFRPDWDGAAPRAKRKNHTLLKGFDEKGKARFHMWFWETTPFRVDLPRRDMANVDFWRMAVQSTFHPGDWRHIALTWDAEGWVKFYVDGLPYRHGSVYKTKEGSRRFVDLEMTALRELAVGATNTEGSFDLLNLYSSPLSEAEIAADMRIGMPIDLLLDRDLVPASTDTSLKLLVAPAGHYARPCALPPAKRVAAKLEVTLDPNTDVNTKSWIFPLELDGPRTLNLPLGALTVGEHLLRCTIRGEGTVAQRSFPLRAFSDQPAAPATTADIVPGNTIFSIDFAKDSANAVQHDGPVTLQKSSVGKYLETSASKGSRFAFPIPFPERLRGKPVILEIDWPDDKPRSMGLYMYPESKSKQHRDRLSSGIQTGLEYPNTGRIQTTRHIFYPGVTNFLFEARTMIKDYPAAIAAVRVREITNERLPRLALRLPEGLPARTFGFMDEDQTPHIQFGVDDPDGHSLEAFTSKFRDYFDYTGQTVFSTPAMRYFYLGYPLEGFYGQGLFPAGIRGLGNFTALFGERGLGVLATLNIYTLPDLVLQPDRHDEHLDKGHFHITADGTVAKSGHLGMPKPNFHHPEVKEMLFLHLDELAKRYGSMEGFLGFDIWPGVFALPLNVGYDDDTIATFSRDCQVVMPKDASNSPQARHAFLTGEDMREKWLKWRAEQNTKLFTELVARIATINPKLEVNLKLDLPVKADETTEGVDVKAVLLEKGFDLTALQTIPGLNPYPSHGTNNVRWERFWGHPEVTTDEAIYDFDFLKPFGKVGDYHLFPAYFETFRAPLSPDVYRGYFQDADIKPAGRHFLKQLVYPLGMTDARRILIGAQPLGTLGRNAETREFAKAYRALPALPFDDVEGPRDPVVARSLKTGNGTYLYLVNLLWSPCTAELATHKNAILEDLSNDTTLRPDRDGTASVELKPYQLRSFLVKNEETTLPLPSFLRWRKKATFALRSISVPQTAKDYYAKRIAELEAALQAVAASGDEVTRQRDRLARIKARTKAGNYADAHRLIFSKRMLDLLKLKAVADNGQLQVKNAMLAASTYRIKCGQDAYLQTSDGSLYLPDQAFDGTYGHDGSYKCVARNIDRIDASVALPELYATEAYDVEAYRCKVKPGRYTVRLRFKVGYEPNGKPEKNVINLDLEGQRVLEKWDLFVANGSDFNKAVVKEFRGVTVKDGLLDIEISVPEGIHPTIRFFNAIEVLPEP